MNKKIPFIAAIIIIASIGGIASLYSNEQTNNIIEDDVKTEHDYVWSGPIGVTKYEHTLGENVFFVIRGLQPNEEGTVGIFTPQGVLFKSLEYDGSLKSDFNFYISQRLLIYCGRKFKQNFWRTDDAHRAGQKGNICNPFDLF